MPVEGTSVVRVTAQLHWEAIGRAESRKGMGALAGRLILGSRMSKPQGRTSRKWY